jgi:putative hydrolase of the HAD superfamily
MATAAGSLLGIRGVVLDAVGTLIHPNPPAPVVYAGVGERFGSRWTQAEIVQRFRAAFHHGEAEDWRDNLRTSEEREERRWRHIVNEVLDDVADKEECFRILFDHFAQAAAWRCEDETGPLLSTLAGRGYRLGIASNYDRRLRSVVAGMPALAQVKHLIISAEVGWRKPAAEFFAAVSAALMLPPGEILFVGDDRTNDYEGGRSFGMQVILFDPQEKMIETNVVRIKSLSELLVMLPSASQDLP